MSEYEYYEFRALDRPLTTGDQHELRAISSRATITNRSFTNYYSFGSFMGDPDEFMERWFDLHLYFANWGTRVVKIRMPVSRIPKETLHRFVRGLDGVEYWYSGDNLILTVTREIDDDEDDSWMLDQLQLLADLAPLRDDLIGGDYRLLYLAWLMGLDDGAYQDDVPEPMPGIGPLTPALAAFAEFFRIDPDLVAVAAERPAASEAATSDDAQAVIAALPEDAKTALLIRALDRDPLLASDLAALVRTSVALKSGTPDGARPRAVGDLLAAARARRMR